MVESLEREVRATTLADKEFEPGIDTNRFRTRRFREFVDHVEARCDTGRTLRVIDVGGSRAFWQGQRAAWAHLDLDITIVNLDAAPSDDGPYHIRPGNACRLSEHADGAFDVVHSNSVIEHVGHWHEMRAMAAEVRRLAPVYYVQTPNFGFPLEPHFRTLFFHWYPEIVRARMLMRRKRGFRGPLATLGEAMGSVQSINLLTAGQMQALFPDARIARERVLGLTKSVIAIR